MPQKPITELDIARTLAQAQTDVCLIPIKIAGQQYKTTPQEYVERFYADFQRVEAYHFDGLIITGAPVEQIPFEAVRYWHQLQHIMDWAVDHANSTLYICWGAQAGLYHHYGIPKYGLPEKKFGVFPQNQLQADIPLLHDLPPIFHMPHSRHTEIRKSDLLQHSDSLTLLAESPATGVSIIAGSKGADIYITGHLEYEPTTLHREYQRDLSKGLPIQMPVNYYVDDDPARGVNYSWQSASVKFYSNWIEYYC
jgi:homoserine O-succinyltransferase